MRCLQIVPVLIDTWVVGNAHTVGYAIELVESLALHRVSEPAAAVALLVVPRESVGHIKTANTVEFVAYLRRSSKRDSAALSACRQRLDEVEDVARQRLGDAESR